MAANATRGSAKSPAEENSERKRISIPKADESSLAWWNTQKDPGLSVRLLIRNEIQRSGYTDTAFRPVAQLPRRGRPPGSPEAVDGLEGPLESTEQGFADESQIYAADGPSTMPVARTPVVAPAPVQVPTPIPVPAPAAQAERTQAPQAAPTTAATTSPAKRVAALDDLMNG